jgi:hypothetical protein
LALCQATGAARQPDESGAPGIRKKAMVIGDE